MTTARPPGSRRSSGSRRIQTAGLAGPAADSAPYVRGLPARAGSWRLRTALRTVAGTRSRSSSYSRRSSAWLSSGARVSSASRSNSPARSSPIVSAGVGIAPQQSQGSSSMLSKAAPSRIRLAAIHQSPASGSWLSPNFAGSASPARNRRHASPPTRNWSLGTSVRSNSVWNQPCCTSSICASISRQRCCPESQYSVTQWSSNHPVPKYPPNPQRARAGVPCARSMAASSTVKCRQLPGTRPSGDRAWSSGRGSRATISASRSAAGRTCTVQRSASASVTP